MKIIRDEEPKKEFKPFKILVENLEEARCFVSLFNCNIHDFVEFVNAHPDAQNFPYEPIKKKPFVEYYDFVDAVKRAERGE